MRRPGTTSAAYLTERGIPFDTVPDVETGIRQLKSGEADALIYDAPVLQYFSNLSLSNGVELVPVVFQNENYGIVIQQDSELVEDINRALLRIQENGVYDQLTLRWFGR